MENSSTLRDRPYLLSSTRCTFASVLLPSFAPEWKYQYSLMGQSLSAGMNFFRLSTGGIVSLSPSSADDPRALPYFSLNQKYGGLQTYGPYMWMPLQLRLNDETVFSTAFCQCSSRRIWL